MDNKKLPLRILVLGDIHGEISSVGRVVMTVQQKRFDGIFLVGDIGVASLENQRERASKIKNGIYRASVSCVFETLRELGAPIFYVPGNWDPKNIGLNLDQVNNVDLNGEGHICKLGDFQIVGLGGSSSIGMNFPYEWPDKDMKDRIKKIFEGVVAWNKTIMISHDLPFRSKIDINVQKRHAGSKAVRELIKDFSPALCLAGHIHEGVGLDVVGESSLAVNAGSLLTKQTTDMHLSQRMVNLRVSYEEQFFVLEFFEFNRIVAEHFFFLGGRLMVRKYIKKEDGIFADTSQGQQLLKPIEKATKSPLKK